MSHLLKGALALFSMSLLGPSMARADLPEVVSSPVFEGVCEALRTSTSCDDCACKPLTSTFGSAESDARHTILVRLDSPTDAAGGKFISHLAFVVGDETALRPVGVLHSSTSTTEDVRFTEVELNGTQVFNDSDEEDPSFVHLFDIVIRSTRMREGETFSMLEDISEMGLLVACMGPTFACHALPISTFSVTNTLPSAPGDKGKKGKKTGWSRTWKMGGKGGKFLVLGPLTGAKANEVKPLFDSEPRQLRLSELPQRKHVISAR
jgi:hypothetical protein